MRNLQNFFLFSQISLVFPTLNWEKREEVNEEKISTFQ